MATHKNYMSIDIRVFDACYSHIQMFRIAKIMHSLSKSIETDCLDPDKAEENDKIFIPRDEYESLLWKTCRETAKKELKILLERVENGQKGGRPVATKEEQQATLDNFTNTFGKPTGVNEVRITKDFKLPAHPYFDSYHKTYPAQLIKNVEQWLVKTKLGKDVEYQWIGKQIQNFNKRKTWKVF